MNPRIINKTQRGLSLIEILCVIVILGLIMGTAIFVGVGVLGGAKEDTTKIKLQNLESSLQTYQLHIGSYPTDDQGLEALKTQPDFDDEKTGDKWKGPYAKGDFNDALGNPINYEQQDAADGGKPYRLYSNGADGAADTDDDVTLDGSEDEDAG